MRKGFVNSTSSRWNADASELTSSWPSKFSKVKLTSDHLTSSSAHRSRAKRAHLQITTRTKPSAAQERCIFCSCCEILEQISGASKCVNLSVYLKNALGPWIVWNPSCSTCVLTVRLHRVFSLYCNPRLFIFPLPPNTDQFMWLLMALVANPTINRKIYIYCFVHDCLSLGPIKVLPILCPHWGPFRSQPPKECYSDLFQ